MLDYKGTAVRPSCSGINGREGFYQQYFTKRSQFCEKICASRIERHWLAPWEIREKKMLCMSRENYRHAPFKGISKPAHEGPLNNNNIAHLQTTSPLPSMTRASIFECTEQETSYKCV